MFVGASELALGVALQMDARGCWFGLGLRIFAVGAGTVVRTLLSMLELSLLMFDCIPLREFAASVVCDCLSALHFSSHAFGFDWRQSLGKRRTVIELVLLVDFLF